MTSPISLFNSSERVDGFSIRIPSVLPPRTSRAKELRFGIHDSYPSLERSNLKEMKMVDSPDNPSEDSETVEKNGSADSSLEDKVAGRKKRLCVGYIVSSIAYLVASLSHTLLRGFHVWSLYYVFSGGTITMAMLLYILKGAVSNDRLSSDTYKRLNLSIIAFTILQLLLPVTSWSEWRFFKVPAIFALVNCVKGYSYGVLGWNKSKGTRAITTDLKEGFRSSLRGLVEIKKQSVGYLIGTSFVGAMSVVKLIELLKVLLFPGEGTTSASMMILSRMSRLARLSLMTSIMYTLKDASDRGRLSGTTFVQLNYLMTAGFLTMSFYLSPMGPTPLGMLSGGLSVQTLFNGITNVQKKK